MPLGLLAAAAFGFGIYQSGAPARSQRAIVQRYARAYEHRDYAAMYALLSSASQRQISASQFTAALRAAAQTATVSALYSKLKVSLDGSVARVPFEVRTVMFGRFRDDLTLALVGGGGATRFAYSTALLLPGMHAGEQLSRTTQLGTRGNLLAANGQLLAAGTSLQSAIPAVANEIVGSLGRIPVAQRATYAAEGYPARAKVGIDGLEEIFERQLAGTPGGTLESGDRTLASSAPVDGTNVRTTIVPSLEAAAIAAIGSSYAGMTVMNPTTGAIEAAVGIAFNGLSPPGSTFKIITAAAALTSGVATMSSTYPYASSAYIGGYKLQDAAGESCGGSLTYAFAQSCNTVFAPIGVSVGASRLVAMAEAFGFNQTIYPGVVDTSTIPSASTIGGATAVGSSAIGQGEVEATTLQIADVGATIENGGKRPIPTFLYGAKPRYVQVISASVAADIQKMMIAVVTEGTGVTAAISGVTVAGKTGTAELANTANQTNNTAETDAWFVGYAPASTPGAAKAVACALYPAAGYGEDTAAPAVRAVLEAALGK